MAKSNDFHCSVITPERAVLECDATAAVFPAHDGELGVLNNRSPLICKLGIGVLRIEGRDQNHRLFVDRGFAQVSGNTLTILTEQAKRPEEIQPEQAEKSLVEARAMKMPDDEAFEARTQAIQRAQVQLKLAKR